jgi:muramoyltetrapeptide carboxypeptidase
VKQANNFRVVRVFRGSVIKMNLKKILPAPLIPGDTIGIAAPASPFNMRDFYLGADVLKSMGFRTVISGNIFKIKGYLAGSDEHRAGLVNKLFADSNIKGIICARGGFGSVRTLSLLDFETIRKNPKVFAGFSDISVLLWALYVKCGLVTFHSPLVTTLRHAGQKTKEAFFSAISSEKRLEIKPEKGTVLKKGAAWGTVSGGNLSSLCHLVGTPFQPCFTGHILILEDRGEPAYKIDRMLMQMKLARCFDGLAGLVLGSFEDCGRTGDIFRIVKNIFRNESFPILAGFDVGHGQRNITIPMGLDASLDADRQALVFNRQVESCR